MDGVRIFHINWQFPEKCKSCCHWDKNNWFCQIGPEAEDMWFEGNEALCLRYDEMATEEQIQEYNRKRYNFTVKDDGHD
jgi:hypothetical protein